MNRYKGNRNYLESLLSWNHAFWKGFPHKKGDTKIVSPEFFLILYSSSQ